MLDTATQPTNTQAQYADNPYVQNHPDPSYCPKFTCLEDMRRDYDKFALHLTLGLSLEQAARLRGVSMRTAQAIIKHPLFQELLDAKRVEATQIRAEVAHDMIRVGSKGFKKLEDFLDSGKLSFGDTLKVTAFCMDRDPEGQFAKTSKKKTEHRHVWDGTMIEQLKANAAHAGLETIDVEALTDEGSADVAEQSEIAQITQETCFQAESTGETAGIEAEITPETGSCGDVDAQNGE